MLLEGKNLSKRYARSGLQVEALKDFSFHLKQGEILGIAGESGSGKSTLLRLISGLEAPTAGELYLKDAPLPKRRTKAHFRTMQMIFQDAAGSFHPRRSIASSIRETFRSLCGSQAELFLAELCRSVGLDPALAERLPKSLSGGQCQRFAIARALAVSPEILLCDEITSALDVSTQEVILLLLKDLFRQKQMSAVFVSHDLAVLSNLCDRIMVMQKGLLVEEGPTDQILRQPKMAYTQKLLSSVLEIPEALSR